MRLHLPVCNFNGLQSKVRFVLTVFGDSPIKRQLNLGNLVMAWLRYCHYDELEMILCIVEMLQASHCQPVPHMLQWHRDYSLS